MAHDTLRDTGLVRALTDLMTDLSDLFQKELRLAHAEITDKLTLRLQGSLWIAAAGLLAILAALVLIEGIVFELVNVGLPAYGACFLTGGILALAALVVFLYGRQRIAADLTPARTVRQFNETIRTAREQIG
jgi:hypothetical protein